MTSESAQVADIRAAIDAQLAGVSQQWHAYDYDDVPGELPANYVLVTLTRRFGDDLRFSAGRQLVGYRLTTLVVGQTVDQTRWVRERVYRGLSDQSLTLDGTPTTFVRFESESAIAYDDGRYSGQTIWTYAL